MRSAQCRHGFQLKNHAFLDDDVSPVIANTYTLVYYGNRNFLLAFKAKLFQFDHQGVLIHLFKIARSEMSMDCHRSTCYLVAKFLNIHNSVNSVNYVSNLRAILHLEFLDLHFATVVDDCDALCEYI